MAVAEPMFLYSLRFSAANPVIRVTTTPTGTQSLTLSVAILTNYFMSGDAVAASDLVRILQNCLNTNADGVTFTVTIDSRNFITIASSAAVSILWADAATTVDETIFGFTANVGPGTSFTAPYQTKGVWMPGTSTRTVGAWKDSRKEPVTVGATMEASNGDSRGYDLSTARAERMVAFHYVDRAKILTEYAPAAEPYGALEYAWTNGLGRGLECRYYPDRTSRTTTSYMRARMRNRGRPWREMDVSTIQRYEIDFSMREVG